MTSAVEEEKEGKENKEEEEEEKESLISVDYIIYHLQFSILFYVYPFNTLYY